MTAPSKPARPATAPAKGAAKRVDVRTQKAEEKLEKFIEHYLLFKNGKQAAIAAGYAPRSAEVSASRLLSTDKAQAALARQKAERAAAMRTGRDELEDELRQIAFGDMADLATWGPRGVKFKASRSVNPMVRRTLSEISSSETQFGTTVRVKRADKLMAIKLLGQMAGILDPDSQDSTVTVRVLRG